jgi:hypothetical protein
MINGIMYTKSEDLIKLKMEVMQIRILKARLALEDSKDGMNLQTSNQNRLNIVYSFLDEDPDAPSWVEP